MPGTDFEREWRTRKNRIDPKLDAAGWSRRREVTHRGWVALTHDANIRYTSRATAVNTVEYTRVRRR